MTSFGSLLRVKIVGKARNIFPYTTWRYPSQLDRKVTAAVRAIHLWDDEVNNSALTSHNFISVRTWFPLLAGSTRFWIRTTLRLIISLRGQLGMELSWTGNVSLEWVVATITDAHFEILRFNLCEEIGAIRGLGAQVTHIFSPFRDLVTIIRYWFQDLLERGEYSRKKCRTADSVCDFGY